MSGSDASDVRDVSVVCLSPIPRQSAQHHCTPVLLDIFYLYCFLQSLTMSVSNALSYHHIS